MAEQIVEMELEQFVQRSLEQIARGVEGAKKSLDKAEGIGGAIINPVVYNNVTHPPNGLLTWDNVGNKRLAVEVEFDLSVSAVNSSSAEGGGKVGVGIASIVKLNAGGSKHFQAGSEVANRLRFTVPMLLPWWEKDRPAADR